MANNVASVAKPSGDTKGGKDGSPKDAADAANQGGNAAPPVKQITTPNKATVTPGQAQAEQPDPYKFRDLMAQEDMAHWAMWMFVAAVATWVVTSIGTFFIWRQVTLTRKAVEDTSEATDAMRRANDIAEDATNRQLRAYVSVHPKGVFERDDADGFVRVPILVQNDGQTPAYKVDVESWFEIEMGPPHLHDARPEQDFTRANMGNSELVMGPGVSDHVYVTMPFSLVPELMNALARKEVAIIHAGVVRYEDAFGAVRFTDFSHYHRGEELSDANSMRCHFGNRAT